MSILFHDQPIFGPRGPVGPDGNPIGTIISFMGTTPPNDYLICDGTEYRISDNPDLSAFFSKQFGSSNYFGGDGETTFAVPDMRNLFLRGYRGESEETLSGEIGIRQDGTGFPSLWYDDALNIGIYSNLEAIENGTAKAKNVDGILKYGSKYGYVRPSSTGNLAEGQLESLFTARPVNMAVLYCIKAILSIPLLDEYDTDDGWHVRKWSDGFVEMTLNSGLSTVNLNGSNAGPFPIFSNRTLPVQLVEKYLELGTVNRTSSTAMTNIYALNPLLESITEEEMLIKTGSYWVVLGTSAHSLTVVASLLVSGRWK